MRVRGDKCLVERRSQVEQNMTDRLISTPRVIYDDSGRKVWVVESGISNEPMNEVKRADSFNLNQWAV